MLSLLFILPVRRRSKRVVELGGIRRFVGPRGLALAVLESRRRLLGIVVGGGAAEASTTAIGTSTLGDIHPE
jgi:hypothetical protein